jgi:lipopolysaccharide transport system permease protein
MFRQLPHILLFARQDLLDRHRDSLLGIFWVFLQPLAYILIYSLVFSELMKSRLTGFEDQPFAYTQYLISGLLVWMLMSNTISQLSAIYQTKAHIIRKIPVSLSIMPLYVPLVETVIYLFGMLVFALMLILMGQTITWYWLWLPVVLVLVLAVAYPFGLILGMLGVFLPDLRTATPIALQLVFWLTPIVYLAAILPESVQTFVHYNPFSWATESVQAIVLYQRSPQLGHLIALFFLAVVLLLTARWLQNRLEKDIRDLV